MPYEEDKIKVLLELLQEYAPKLRAKCREYEQARLARFTSVVFSYLLASAGVFMSMYATREQGNAVYFVVLLSTAVGFGGLAAYAASRFFVSWRERSINFEELMILKGQVATLVTTASQLDEHTKVNWPDKLKLNMRLAEAEAAIKFYEDILSRRRSGAATEIAVLRKQQEIMRRTILESEQTMAGQKKLS